MESNDLKKLALIYSMQAEIEGMKADNVQSEIEGKSLAYVYEDFKAKAAELENLAHVHDIMQLYG